MAAMNKLTHTMTYDVPLADVRAMLADRTYRDQVLVAQGSVSGSVDLEVDGATMTVVVDQVRPADDIPSYARKFIGDQINIVRREEWTAVDQAGLDVTIPGKPGQMAGSISLVENGGSTAVNVDVAITVNIPLVGGRIEKLIADLLRRALRDEEQAGRAYLSR